MMAGRRNIWMASQEDQLFQLQNIYGNKWAFIASKMGWKADIIKNKFYSTLRRGHRKLNKYIVNIKKKQDPIKYRGYKAIQDIFIPKLIAVADDHYDDKYQTKHLALQLAPQIQAGLIQIACNDDQYLFRKQSQYYKEEQLLKKIMDFNKNCKRRKGKKRDDAQKHKPAKQKDVDESESNISIEPEVSVKIDNIKFEEKSVKEFKQHQSIEILGSIFSSNEDNRKTNIISSFAPNDQHQSKQIYGQVKKQQYSEGDPKFSLPFLKTIQKKQSVSLLISDSQFQKKAVWFKQIQDSAVGDESSLIKSSTSMSHSIWMKQRQPVWLYQSTSSRQSFIKPTKVLSNYLTEPSPTPNDSPFSYINIMKNKNVTNSQMFQEKISIPSEDPLNNSQNFTYGSFIQQMPIFMAKTGQFLIKSADLKQEIMQQEVLLNNSANIEREKDTLNHELKRNGFVNEYNFSTGEEPSYL